MTPRAFIEDYIRSWEGGLSLDRNDNGNWFLYGAPSRIGQGIFVGSKYGVTGTTLAAYRGKRRITAAEMAALSLDEACAIAKKLFYDDPGISRLAWNRVTASILDFGWGAGPARSARTLRNLLDIEQGSSIGPVTIAAYSKLLLQGEEFAAGAWWAMRETYYEALVDRRPSDGIYLKGWDNRSRYFTPASDWWAKW